MASLLKALLILYTSNHRTESLTLCDMEVVLRLLLTEGSKHFNPFDSQDLIVNSPLLLLHITLLISYVNFVLEQDNIFCLICVSLLTVCWIMNGYFREKLHVKHF